MTETAKRMESDTGKAGAELEIPISVKTRSLVSALARDSHLAGKDQDQE